MHVEVTRMITAWLGHAAHGVNALLPGIARDHVGGTKEDDEPVAVSIYDDIDFEDLDDVGGFNPPHRPALAIICDVNPEGTDITQPTKKGHVYGITGAVAYYAEDGTGRARARRDGNYVLRAVGQSLNRFNQGQLSEGYRELNDVKLAQLTKLSFQRVAGAVPESSLMGIVFFDGTIVNKAP